MGDFKMRFILAAAFMLAPISMSVSVQAAEIGVGDSAPLFQAKTHEGKPFDLAERKGKWTVLYFYPKADTPGCTKQACSFRDSVGKIRALNAEVFGISADSVESIAKFHEKYHLSFPLLADPDLKATKAYGAKMPIMGMSKRWTFIIDPALKIRAIDQNVDPVKDAENVSKKIKELQSKA